MPGMRRWIKLWVMESLEGSIRYQLEAAERCVWYDLLLFSATCDPPGKIADRDGRPFPRKYLASRLNVSEELFTQALKKSLDEGRITEQAGVLLITHWEKYQSEYDRQRPYREAKKEAEELADLTDDDLTDQYRRGELTSSEFVTARKRLTPLKRIQAENQAIIAKREREKRG